MKRQPRGGIFRGPRWGRLRGVTGADGTVASACALPDLGTGNAALIIAASSALGNNEIKQLIKKKKPR